VSGVEGLRMTELVRWINEQDKPLSYSNRS
jgi:hypothetical protein